MIVAMIPARLESTRLERKLLLSETGRPIIRHTVEQVRKAKHVDQIIVATDSQLIVNAVGGICDCILTTPDCKSGTDRIAQTMYRLWEKPQIIVGCQGDEPEIDPLLIDRMIEHCTNYRPDLTTACTPLSRGEEDDPSAVKVTLDGYAAKSFSRDFKPGAWRHLGIYVYTPTYLEWFARTPQTDREVSESLEQLRALGWKKRIECVRTASAFKGIDCESDYRSFVERHRKTVGVVGEVEREHLPQHG